MPTLSTPSRLNPLSFVKRLLTRPPRSEGPTSVPTLTPPHPTRAEPSLSPRSNGVAAPVYTGESAAAQDEEHRKRRRPRRRKPSDGQRPVEGAQAPTQEVSYQPFDFGGVTVSGEVARALKDMGYVDPSPVQVEVIPLMSSGRDVVGQAQTGTGKTAAFGIPLVEMLDPNLQETQAVVLVPTRELALQVSGELSKLARYKGHRVVTIYGGQPIVRQFAQLDPPPQIIVGTPGRVLDHMGRGTLRLDKVRIVVLDEADEMLDIGFAPDMERILRTTPRDRQTTLFSATMPPFIMRMIRKYLRNPEWVQIAPEEATVPEIDQVYYEVAERDKLPALAALLKEWGELPRTLIFCRMQIGVDRLTAALQRRGYHVEGIHGGLTQGERTRVMTGFRSGHIQAIIATNVASRGLDIPDITHVVSYDAPQNTEECIHRIGRTGRMGRSGKAITFFAEWDYEVLQQVQGIMGDNLREEKSSIYRVATG